MDPNHLPRITPSKIDCWRGTRIDGRPLTRQQDASAAAHASKIAAARARYQLPATYGVRLQPERTSLSGPPPAAIVILCPVVSCSKDRKRICVIAPNGDDLWVNWSQR